MAYIIFNERQIISKLNYLHNKVTRRQGMHVYAVLAGNVMENV